MSQTLKIQHNLADVVIKPSGQVNLKSLKANDPLHTGSIPA